MSDVGVLARHEVVRAVRTHATNHYEEDGWDFVVECWSDDEIYDVYRECWDLQKTIDNIHEAVKICNDRRKDQEGWREV